VSVAAKAFHFELTIFAIGFPFGTDLVVRLHHSSLLATQFRGKAARALTAFVIGPDGLSYEDCSVGSGRDGLTIPMSDHVPQLAARRPTGVSLR
jgi:hypothetical protein